MDIKQWKWKTLLGLALVYIAVIFNWSWVWGVLFLYWLIPSWISRQVFFIEMVTEKDEPILYWVIMLTWFLLSLFFILETLIYRVLEDLS